MGGVMYFLYDPLVAIVQSELLVIGLTALGGLIYGEL
jgi:hypothetical protein